MKKPPEKIKISSWMWFVVFICCVVILSNLFTRKTKVVVEERNTVKDLFYSGVDTNMNLYVPEGKSVEIRDFDPLAPVAKIKKPEIKNNSNQRGQPQLYYEKTDEKITLIQ